MALRMTDDEIDPELVTTTAPCRLIIRGATPGVAVAWPMLVADPCPWALWQGHGLPHAHVHFITGPPPWYRIAPCCRQPYKLELSAA